MKRLMTSLLALVMTCFLCVPALAAGEGSYSMAIQVNGGSSATVKPGSTVTVTLTMSKDNADSFDLYSMQDYIRFDTNYLTYVEDSISVYTAGEGLPAPVFSASIIDYPGSHGTDNAVFVNRASNSVQVLPSGATVVTFQLKAEATGTTTLTHSTTEVFQTPGSLYDTSCKDATVTISNTAGGGETGGGSGGGGGSIGGGGSAGGGGETEQPEDPTDQPELPSGGLPFIDVPAEAWYEEAVQYVYERGLMSGTGADTFSPSLSTDRSMLVTILYRLDGSPEVNQNSPFEDVPTDTWYTTAVAWGVSNGIVAGYGNGNFGPSDPVTREQLATILYRYVAYRGGDTSASSPLDGYTDEEAVSVWAEKSLEWAVGAHIISGTDTKALLPGGHASRAEAAQMLMALCERILK